MKTIEKQANKDITLSTFVAPFFDAWIVMLCLGAIAERLRLYNA